MTDKDVIAMYKRGISVECIADMFCGGRKGLTRKKSRDIVSEIILKHWREIVK